ncbi:MAG: ABC transporter permease [Deltaproteobacteria bacterium]|nr:ABC transporter permease [Deltaproteobacteria bacterium]
MSTRNTYAMIGFPGANLCGLARRWIWPRRQYLFARFLTLTAIAGVGISVFAMTLVLAVMGGFRTELERKLLGIAPHLTITPTGEDPATIDTIAHAVASSVEDPGAAELFRMVEGEAIIQRAVGAGFSDQGVKIRGVDTAQYRRWPTANVWTREVSGASGPTVLLGSELYLNLGIGIDPSETVRLIAPLGMLTPAGELAPIVREYTVTGWLRTGFFEQDTKLVIMPADEAERLLGLQSVSRWVVYLNRPMRAGSVAAAVQARLAGHAEVASWEGQNRRLLNALRLERIVMTVILLLMVLIATAGICGVVFLHVAWRQRDLAILWAIGAPGWFLVRLVLQVGACIGGLGSLCGLAGAGIAGVWLARHPIRLPATFYLDHLPVEWHGLRCAAIGLAGIMLAVAAAVVPAWRLRRFSPTEALRYE